MDMRERFSAVMRFDMNVDRLPRVEWAAWWDKTYDRWLGEGLERLDNLPSQAAFGLDPMICIGVNPRSPRVDLTVRDEADYERIRPHLFTDRGIDDFVRALRDIKPLHDRAGCLLRIWLDGFFWFPRTLFGIEPHLFAFYDHPELMARMNSELADYNIRAVNAMYEVLTPDMVGIAEDMSYNLGPMLSEESFDSLLLPYYKKVVPVIKQRPLPLLTDSDGDVTLMLPWLARAGIEGVYPLERQAGVDLAKIRAANPKFLMLGGFDKMVMHRGEAAMRAEFERLLPVMRSGGFINSIDHQTPPDVSLENYRIYLRLLEEYTEKAVR